MGVSQGVMVDAVTALQQRGFVLVPGLVGAREIESLKSLCETADVARAERGGETYGARGLLALPQIHQLVDSPALSERMRAFLGPDFHAVRGIFFDKTENANWPVLWHQDLSLAVKERHELPGWSNWSVKRGVPHVQPPAAVLEKMVTMRLHLDDCPAENGALRVIPGSQTQGLLSREKIGDMTADSAEIVTATAGDALFMRPLILHASSSATAPTHRRVLHLEFAPEGLLPGRLAWAET
jgi:hypothetical protein